METPTTEDDVNVRTPLLRAANNHRVQAINGSIEELVDDRRHSTLTSSAVSSLGFFAVVFLTVNATLGAGLLNIPYAFSQSGGILPASVAQLFQLILVILSLLILSVCSEVSQADSLQGIVQHFCGRFWRNVSLLFIFLYSYGSCVTYVIIIGDQFDKFFETFCPLTYNTHWYFSGHFLLITTAVVTILPLCCSRDIGFLKFASFFGFLCTTYLTVLILVEYVKVKEHGLQRLVKSQPDRWTDIFNVIPVLTFSYQSQLSWVPTYSQIRNRTNHVKLWAMIVVSMLICYLSYTWTAVFGLLAFGSDKIEKDIMQNFNPKDPFVSLAMILLIVKTIVIYPVLLFCGRIVIEDLLRNWSIARERPFLLRLCIATLWVLSSSALAILVPDISVAINYLGVLAVFFVFIFPGMALYNCLFKSELLQAIQCQSRLFSSKLTILTLAVLLLSYGTFTLVISVNQSIKQTTAAS